MTPKEFAKLLERDKHCLHCGSTGDDLIPHHRANRGFGGASKASKFNQPSNIVVMCALANFLMEHDYKFAERARFFGWKLSKHLQPAAEPVYDLPNAVWVLLGDDFSRFELHNFGKGAMLSE